MSITETSADVVQPDQGQGDGGQTSTQPYAEYLGRVPEEVRADIEPIFKDWNSSVNSRFEQHADYRKQWEPFEQAGLNQYDPAQLSQFLQQLSDPEQARAWVNQTYPQQQPAPEPQQQDFGTYDQYDPNAQFNQRFDQLTQTIEQMQQRWQEAEQQRYEQAVNSTIEAAVAKLEAEHGKTLPQGVTMAQIIETFGGKHAVPGADPNEVVQKAWSEYDQLRNLERAAALQSKVDQPNPAVSGGEADLTPPPMPKGRVDALREAEKQARAMVHADLNG